MESSNFSPKPRHTSPHILPREANYETFPDSSGTHGRRKGLKTNRLRGLPLCSVSGFLAKPGGARNIGILDARNHRPEMLAQRAPVVDPQEILAFWRRLLGDRRLRIDSHRRSHRRSHRPGYVAQIGIGSNISASPACETTEV